ncbi:MAG: hypothetical protein AABY10_03625 [Nanoarchaeota archaeon]
MPKSLKYLQKNNILNYPRLDTVLMVEATIKDLGGEHKVAIWKKLPKKMKYQTFCTIVDYLLYSGKIGIDKENKLCWIYDPKLARYYYNRKDLAWKK